MKLLGYTKWRNFEKAIKRAIISCETSNISSGDTSKDEIAFAQSYFAVQTRKRELIEERKVKIYMASMQSLANIFKIIQK